MIAPACSHSWKKNGVDKQGVPRLRCKICGKSVLDRPPTTLGTLRTDLDKAAQAVAMLCEGMSIRAVGRLTGLDKNTVLRIMIYAGEQVAWLSSMTIRNMQVEEVECDEIWGFCFCKKYTQKAEDKGYRCGDIFAYTAIDRNTKLFLTHEVGKRTTETGAIMLQKLKACTTGRFQLSTDAWNAFRGLVDLTWGNNIDYGQIIKIIKGGGGQSAASRYSPGKVSEIRKKVCIGNPDVKRISTSMAERANLSIRMGIRRMTRLTNAFSKKWENHDIMLSLFFGVYNFCKVHGTLKTTPAVAAGLTDHVWTVRELLERAAKVALAA